jgi:pimeloyl-ACP methyl ester carboxylesterase
MVRWLYCYCLVFFLFFPASVYAQPSGSGNWKKEDQARTSAAELKLPTIDLPRGAVAPIPRDAQLRLRLDGTPRAQCGASECFDLFYFKGEKFKNDPARKNVLYIAGGPGDIPPRTDLEYFKDKYNVFYFDPRGAGLSDIDLAKSFDQFLRADFIVNDIEQIRRKELGDDEWDAIYGYSYGTVIAQKYAFNFPNNVRRLILEAPPHRRNETEEARRDKVLENLVNIYRNIRFEDPNAPCNARPEDVVDGDTQQFPKLKKTNIDVEERQFEGFVDIFCDDDFSFLSDSQTQTVKEKLKKEYDALEDEYGSLNLITLNYDRLKQDSRFTEEFPYPKEFFVALRKLQSVGAPQDKNSLFYVEEVEPLVTLAMVVGYYSMFDRDSRNNLRLANFPKCKMDDAAPFLKDVELEKKKKICARIDRAMKDVSKQFRQIESLRGLYVLGIYDGISRWPFEVLEGKQKKNERCNEGLRGKDIEEFVKGNGERRKMLREEAGRIGIVREEPICPWDPGEFRHGVQTLILKGGADAIIAKRQAEDFFRDGLQNPHCQGVLIEFPGRGHDMSMSLRWRELITDDVTPWAKAYRDLVDEFIKPSQSAAEFRANDTVKEALTTLKAKDRTPPAQGPSMACPN